MKKKNITDASFQEVAELIQKAQLNNGYYLNQILSPLVRELIRSNSLNKILCVSFMSLVIFVVKFL